MAAYGNRTKAGGYLRNSLPIINASAKGGAYQKLTAAGVFTALDVTTDGDIFVVYVTEDSFVSFGTAPNAATDTNKFFIPANSERTFAVDTGMKMAWAPGT